MRESQKLELWKRKDYGTASIKKIMAGEGSSHYSFISKGTHNNKHKQSVAASSSINEDREEQENRVSEMLVGSVRNLETDNPLYNEGANNNHCYNAWLSDTSRTNSIMTGDENPLQNFLISQMAVI